MEGISEYISGLDYMVVGAYLVILIGIGYWVSFVKKRESDENLFLAGNSLGASSIGLTMWGTNIGPSSLVASCSIGYTTGIVAGNFSWLAFPFLILLAFVFAPKYLDAKTTTLPEFMGKRFGESTRNILAWYASVTILISWLGLTIFAGGIIVQQVLGVPFWAAAVLLVLLAVFFTIAGGLEAIAYTNLFQMTLMILVSLGLTITGIYSAGGINEIYEATPKEYWNLLLPADDPNYPWIALILGYPVMGVWFWCTDQSMVQSVLGAKKLEEGQYGANLTGWLKILEVGLFILPGIICFVLFPDLKDPDEAYMTMVTRLLPTGIIGLVIAVIIASLVSTIDSALNSLSTVFTMDIYVKKFKPQATTKEIIKIGRIVVLFGAVAAVFIAMAVNSVKGLNLFDIFQAILGFVAPPLTVVFLFGVLWKKTTTRAANFTLSVGTAISIGVGALYLWIFPKAEYDFWPHFLLLSFYIFCLLAFLAWLITIFDKKSEDQNVLNFKPLESPSSSMKLAWGSLVVVMIALYIIFNGHKSEGEPIIPNDETTKEIVEEERQLLVEIVMPMDAKDVVLPSEMLAKTGVEPFYIRRWKNRILLTHIPEDEIEDIAKKASELGIGEVVIYKDLFYDFTRSWCEKDSVQVADISEFCISTNMVADTTMQNEYIKLHVEQQILWPEVGEGFCNEGFQYITMWKSDRRLVLIVGIPSDMDLDEMSKKNAENHPKVQEWNEYMGQFQEELPGAEAGQKWIFMNKIEE